MHSSIYIIFSLGIQLLFFTQIIKSLYLLDQCADLIKTTYTNEKEIRLYGEVKTLIKNIEESKKYLDKKIDESVNSSDNTASDNSDTQQDYLDRITQQNNILESYLNKLNRFIDRNFTHSIQLGSSFYVPRIYRQHNPRLDPLYPNWSWRFSLNEN